MTIPRCRDVQQHRQPRPLGQRLRLGSRRGVDDGATEATRVGHAADPVTGHLASDVGGVARAARRLVGAEGIEGEVVWLRAGATATATTLAVAA